MRGLRAGCVRVIEGVGVFCPLSENLLRVAEVAGDEGDKLFAGAGERGGAAFA